MYKKENPNEIVKYRHISPTLIAFKLLEHIVHSSIINFFVQKITFFKITNMDLVDKLRNPTVSDFTNCYNNKQQIDSVVFHFSKAFDKYTMLSPYQN